MSFIFPDDPAPNGYVSNPYEKEQAAAYDYMKRECDSTDGWSSIGTKNGVVMEKKTIAGDPSTIPLVRGKGLIKNFFPTKFYPLATLPGARIHWDARYLEGQALERYSRRSYKFYGVQKGAFLVSPRDFVGTQAVFTEDDGTTYIAQCSVPDNDQTPPVSGKVRGWLTVGGWKLRPAGDDLELTYIVKVDPKGSLPNAVVNQVVQAIPECVVNITSWAGSNGFVPYIKQEPAATSFRSESYTDEASRQYKLGLLCRSDAVEELDLVIDAAVKYVKGYTVRLDNEAKDLVKVEEQPGNLKLIISPEANEKKLDLFITAKK